MQQLDYATLKLKPLPIKPSELENAASRILNDLAVLRLRAGDPLGAARLLEQISTTHPHGQYNLACAYARLGLADSGVQSLRRAPAAPGLANKISRDADFNLIRKSPELISFLTTLSTDAGL